MEYYNSKGERIIYNLNKPKYQGKSSQIFELESGYCLKQYFPYSTESVRMNQELFCLLKKLNHPNINRVIELYYDFSKIKSLEYLRSHIQSLEPDAYKYLYIEDSFIDIMRKSTEYLLYNLQELESLINTFTELGVWIRDFKRENAVYFEDRIILIDLDCCKIIKDCSHDEIQKNNTRCLEELFIDLFEKCRSYSYKYEDEVFDLFTSEENISITSSVSKKLCRCKTPFDYIKQ